MDDDADGPAVLRNRQPPLLGGERARESGERAGALLEPLGERVRAPGRRRERDLGAL
jgi:hypothetical protein